MRCLAPCTLLALHAHVCPPCTGRRGIRMQAEPPGQKPGQGYYRRPSAALERGGGFFVPGLEGARLRLVAAGTLCAALALNRLLASSGGAEPSQLGSELLGAAGCAAVFAQSFAQQQQDQQREADALRAALTLRLKEEQELSGALPPAAAERARFVATTLLRLTPASAVVWAEGDGTPLLRFGRGFGADGAGSAALALLVPDGRSSHYCAGLEGRAPPPLPSNTESAIVCRCGGGRLLALGSERPAAFSQVHLDRAERMARNLDLEPRAEEAVPGEQATD